MRSWWSRIAELLRMSRATRDQGRRAREAARDQAAADELQSARDHRSQRPWGF